MAQSVNSATVVAAYNINRWVNRVNVVAAFSHGVVTLQFTSIFLKFNDHSGIFQGIVLY